MKLTHIRIKDYRSFSGEHEFDLSDGVNYFVGPNNCGKSNLARALELALDPDAEYVPERDRPRREGPASSGPKTTTRITVTFQIGNSSPEKTLFAYAKAYEMLLGKTKTFADERQIHFVTTFAGPVRQVSFQAKGAGARSAPVDSKEHQQLLKQFRAVVRFAVIHSGEDLESLLKGKFREILRLVIADHLSSELATAQEARASYVAALQMALLEPLRARIETLVGGMFPEIRAAVLVPEVPTVEQTLSSVDILLGDTLPTQLTEKGTGVRGAVLLSMLQYLADESRRSLVLAVEEPEAFLHPAAQEAIGTELEGLATRQDVTVLATTHSPYVISRRPDTSVTELCKGEDGFTHKAAVAGGDEARAEVLGSLFRDVAMAAMVERALTLPAGTRGVLITEGFTDAAFLRAGCAAADRSDLMDGIHVIQANGSKRIIIQSVLTQSATDLPVVALLDLDDNGRKTQSQLEDFGWSKTREIFSLGKWEKKCSRGHDVEIESLIPLPVAEQIIATLGEDVAVTAKRACNGGWHYEFSDTWKERAVIELPRLLKASGAPDLVWVATEVDDRFAKVAAAKKTAAAHRTSAGVA